MNYAPIALFVYNRPLHTRRTVAALLANAEATDSALYIFSDGAKNDSALNSVMEVRSLLRDITGFKSVFIIERENNFGLARSIIAGVSQLCQEYGRVIVVEDDLVTSPYFLKFMNDGLAMYENDERVISIAAYQYPLTATLPETLFLKGADCWGWATWQRGWCLFEADGQVLLRELTQRKLRYRFDFDDSYPYTTMLKDQIKGKNNSWAIRWYASAFLKDKLTLYPGRSLVLNIGNDSSGTHCSTTSTFSGGVADSPVMVAPIESVENLWVRQQVINFFRATRPLWPIRIMRKLAKLISP